MNLKHHRDKEKTKIILIKNQLQTGSKSSGLDLINCIARNDHRFAMFRGIRRAEYGKRQHYLSTFFSTGWLLCLYFSVCSLLNCLTLIVVHHLFNYCFYYCMRFYYFAEFIFLSLNWKIVHCNRKNIINPYGGTHSVVLYFHIRSPEISNFNGKALPKCSNCIKSYVDSIFLCLLNFFLLFFVNDNLVLNPVWNTSDMHAQDQNGRRPVGSGGF